MLASPCYAGPQLLCGDSGVVLSLPLPPPRASPCATCYPQPLAPRLASRCYATSLLDVELRGLWSEYGARALLVLSPLLLRIGATQRLPCAALSVPPRLASLRCAWRSCGARAEPCTRSPIVPSALWSRALFRSQHRGPALPCLSRCHRPALPVIQQHTKALRCRFPTWGCAASGVSSQRGPYCFVLHRCLALAPRSVTCWSLPSQPCLASLAPRRGAVLASPCYAGPQGFGGLHPPAKFGHATASLWRLAASRAPSAF